MGLGGVGAAHRQLHDHACAPRVAAEEPVAQRAFHLLVCAVARELSVEDTLCEHGCRQVV